MRLHCCWLLLACITATNALTVIDPAPNSTLAVGSEFFLAWYTNQTVSPTLLVTISLLSSPSTSDVVTTLATTAEESGSQMIVINHALPNTAYYLSLNDSNSPAVVAGPYYFSNSTNLPTAQASPTSTPNNDSTNQSFAFHDSWHSSMLPLIVTLFAIAGLLVIAFFVRRSGLYATIRRKFSRSSDSSDIRSHNDPTINEEQNQVTEVNHANSERSISEEQAHFAQVNPLATLSNSILTVSHSASASVSAHSTDN